MTDKPLADVWADRDFPVLVDVTRRIDQGETAVRPEDVAAALDMPLEDVRRAAKALAVRRFVEVSETGEGTVIFLFHVSSDAYLITGLHPDGDDDLGRLVSLLQQAAERTGDEEEKGLLKRAASALGGLVGTVGANVLSAYLAARLPS